MRQTIVGLRQLIASCLILVTCLLCLAGCGRNSNELLPSTPAPKYLSQLARTTNGVVHVEAKDFRGLGYGLAYAYAQDNVCMFADSLLTVRGERSLFFGPAAHATRRVREEYGAASMYIDLPNEESDFFFKAYLDPAGLEAGYAAASRESRDMLKGYAAGYNRYLKDYAGKLPLACNGAAWVRPITVDDMYLVVAEKAIHASGEVFAKEIVAAGRDPGALSPGLSDVWRGRPDTSFLEERLTKLTAEKLGSNGLALGKESTVNGRGMLLGNPHYPWTSTDRFYQAHLTVPGRYDAMGVILGGIPMVVIGFNKDVAWTHTVTTAVHFTTFKLALDPDDASGMTYFSDGERLRMRAKTVAVQSLQPDGRIVTRGKTFYFSKQGAVIVKPEAGIGWSRSVAHVLADPNRNNTRLIDQWIGIGSAGSVREIKASLDKIVGLPWVNTIAADRGGSVLFADASVVPRVGPEKFASDCLVVPPLLMFDGARDSCGWGQDSDSPAGIYSTQSGPWTIRTDHVGNSNDSFWLSNTTVLLNSQAPGGFSPLYGPVGVAQKLRTRIGFKQIEEALRQRPKLALGDIERLAFANRVYSAELVLPGLLDACSETDDAVLVAACDTLARWDRHANLESRGAVLFREFWNAATTIPNKWAVPFNAADPVHTPHGVAAAAMPAMLQALRAAALKLQALNVPWDGRLADYQTDTRAGVRVPLHGAIGDIDGSYNSIHMGGTLDERGYHEIIWGTSYVQAVTFDDAGPVAHGMLLYGQSVDPKSLYYGDQLPMYSRKQWATLPFTNDKIKADPHYRSVTLTE